MIETGIVMLLQNDSGVAAIAKSAGAFTQIPKGDALPGWTYDFSGSNPTYTHDGPDPLTKRRCQIDCYGTSGAEAIRLSFAIDVVLSGFKGTLRDPDSTVVQGTFRTDLHDFFDDESRTYRRMLEYDLWFNQLNP